VGKASKGPAVENLGEEGNMTLHEYHATSSGVILPVKMTMAILVLYKQGGGSEEIQLVKQVQPARFEVVRRLAIRYLEKKFEMGAAEMLEQLPFELWNGANDFGDSFEVLFMKANMGTYVDIENEVGVWRQRIVEGCPAIASALDRVGSPVRFIAVGLDLDGDVANVSSPTLTMTSSVVEQALREAETLIGAHGAASALDRVHTAFHGHLRFECEREGIENKDDGITTLLSRLREKHPKLKIANLNDKANIDKIFRGLSKIVDALDSIRDHNTLAHPNPLLNDAEAMLVINAVRSMLRYLDSRLR
jgi:hypothetical protein